MSERVIVEFAPIESSLVQELVKLKGFINPRFEKEGIDRMREAEAESLKEMYRVLGGRSRYLKYRVLQEHFYQKQRKK